MDILITGGSGFIGSHVCEYFYEKNTRLYVIDNLSTGSFENIKKFKKINFLQGDITDKEFMEDIFKKYQFDYVIHLAALVSVAESVLKPDESLKINLEATLNLLMLLKKYNKQLKKFVFASSAAVYGNLEKLPKNTNDPVLPQSPYAVDKYAAERQCINFSELFGLPTTALRFFNVYGERQNANSPYSGVISIMENCFRNNKPFTFYGDGMQTRDFVYVKDVVQAINTVLFSEKANGKVFNVGTGKQISLQEIYDIFKELSHNEIQYEYAPERVGDIKYSYADIEDITKLGYKPHYDVIEGLRIYYENNN
ncbi:SDR family NAD(P)-dependent oxidoreductase [Macrococcus bovicus]|uniref:SDR family NAD(P)-dependent oxidoreductase n=1 Tax=Macrococcus bovicus TaxID=69968 RepID=UPI0025A5658F|nr:SDR family NAD(P)-dependent oxidoreductase [Macrococcus bovicus]WJP98485.1 SDR family NAD(P)-dependent oxidoreductase [Macrococcus bovicus]